MECDEKQVKKWHVVGIYSACYNETNRSEFNRLAGDLDRTIEHMWVHLDHLHWSRGATYVSIDVCNDFDRLTQIVEAIYLDTKYNFEGRRHGNLTSLTLSNIAAIYAEVPSEIMNFLKASFFND